MCFYIGTVSKARTAAIKMPVFVVRPASCKSVASVSISPALRQLKADLGLRSCSSSNATPTHYLQREEAVRAPRSGNVVPLSLQQQRDPPDSLDPQLWSCFLTFFSPARHKRQVRWWWGELYELRHKHDPNTKVLGFAREDETT